MKINQILGSEHGISIKSRLLKGHILQGLGHPAEADAVYRQVLQICLSSLGVNHPETLISLEGLGRSLMQLGRVAEAQGLFETIISLRFQRMKASDKVAGFQTDVLWAMNMLGDVLDWRMKYDESERVLDYAQQLLGKATRIKCNQVYRYHYQRARSYQHQGRLDESETILRGLLRYHEDLLTPQPKCIVFGTLADILLRTGRNHEGAYWLKKEYFCAKGVYGLLHRYTMGDCKRLGLCYAHQRQYRRARLFFGSVIEEMTSSTEDTDSRMKYIQEVNAWMLKVEEMRATASTTSNLELEDFEVMELDMDEDIDWEEMWDVPDPLL
jgi:tetratricopeptide (TPR) repeat protein